MSFVFPGRILEEYTVRNNRLGLVRSGDTSHPVFVNLYRVPELVRQR